MSWDEFEEQLVKIFWTIMTIVGLVMVGLILAVLAEGSDTSIPLMLLKLIW